ncbi:MAG: glycosyltransferase family 4 protein [Chloroflexota bacterium]|nr:glycosyltransferase family 4 protein [Chloroflexota bacterium]
MTAARAARRPIAMLTHSYYEEDPRVRREAESLVGAGRPVDVFALRRPGDPASGEVDGVRLHRLDVQRHQGAALPVYLREYVDFFVRASLALVQAQPRRRYALVQVHTLPDFLAFAALPLRLAGVPVLLDLHEAMPEFFRSRFPGAANPLAYRLLLLQERLSIAAASHAITVNDALGRRLVGLGVPGDKVSVVINSPSLVRFDPARHERRAFAQDGTLRLVYAGALTPTYELDVAVQAVARLREARPELPVVLDVYGRGDSEPALRAQADRLGLDGGVVFHGRIPIEDVPAAIAAADIGLAPTRRDEFTDVSLSTKIFEYGAMDKPAVASRLPLVERTFEPGTVATYEPGEPTALADAILRIADDPAGREAAVGRTAARIRDLAWEREAERYIALVDRLAKGR